MRSDIQTNKQNNAKTKTTTKTKTKRDDNNSHNYVWNTFSTVVSVWWKDNIITNVAPQSDRYLETYQNSLEYAQQRWEHVKGDKIFIDDFKVWCNHYAKAKLSLKDSGRRDMCRNFYNHHTNAFVDILPQIALNQTSPPQLQVVQADDVMIGTPSTATAAVTVTDHSSMPVPSHVDESGRASPNVVYDILMGVDETMDIRVDHDGLSNFQYESLFDIKALLSESYSDLEFNDANSYHDDTDSGFIHVSIIPTFYHQCHIHINDHDVILAA